MSALESDGRPSVLILCTGNSCRSQIAEAIWRHMAGDQWLVASAGTRPAGYVHPLALKVLSESGISTQLLHSKSLESLKDRRFDLIIAVCDGANESCPAGLGGARRLLWSYPDPAKPNPADERLADFQAVRDRLQRRIASYLRGEIETHHQVGRSVRAAAPGMTAREMRAAARLIRRALREDLDGKSDMTSAAVIPESAIGSARFVSRSEGIVCGLGICQLAISQFGKELAFVPLARDGQRVISADVIATIAGPARKVLMLERTCLNFLGRLSGISTLTAQFVKRVEGTGCRVMDTRKTTPGWRLLEKYAVRCGGGCNHRMGLFDAILIKDNHLALARQAIDAGSPPQTMARLVREARNWRAKHQSEADSPIPVQVEVDSVDDLDAALEAGPDLVLLDNMTPEQLRACVAARDRTAPQVLLEASGGITLSTAASIAASGVDRISVGALTHSAVNFDIGLDWAEPAAD